MQKLQRFVLYLATTVDLTEDIKTTHHIQVPPDGSPFPQSGGDLMHQRQLCRNDRLLWSDVIETITEK